MIIYYNCDFAGGRDESRRLLKEAISAHTGDPERADRLVSALKTGEKGKPYIEGFDCFSVSHTGSVWAVLIDSRTCGLDIQLAKKCDVTAISRRMYAAEDAEKIAALAGAGGAEAADEFFRLWTRREALAKALGGSVYDSDLPAVSAESVMTGGETYRIYDISFPGADDLYAAVCVRDDGKAETAEPEFRAI